MTNKTRRWVRGGIEVLIHGGTSAIIAAIVSAMQHKKDFSWSSFGTSLGFQFLGNGGVRFMQWWNNNPLPPDDDTGFKDAAGIPLATQPQISLSPLSKVQPINAESKQT